MHNTPSKKVLAICEDLQKREQMPINDTTYYYKVSVEVSVPTIFMTPQQIKINRIARTFGISLAVISIKVIRSSYDNLNPIKFPSKFVVEAIKKIKDIPISQKDFIYYFTTWENEEKMLAVIYKIVKNFKWERDKFDCDDRAKLVSALHSLFSRLNSCGRIYCKITNINTGATDTHHANVVITWDGKVYLFDVDNSGLTAELRPADIPYNFTMGKWHYQFRSVFI